MAKERWYVRTKDGKYLTSATSTMHLGLGSGISKLISRREYAEFGTREEAEMARKKAGCMDISYVTDVPPELKEI